MNRRQIVESVNAALKGSFADLSRGFFRVFGRTKISVLLGFTIAAAYNLDRVRAFRAKMAEEKGGEKESRSTEESNGPSGIAHRRVFPKEVAHGWFVASNRLNGHRSTRETAGPRAGSCRFRGGVRVF